MKEGDKIYMPDETARVFLREYLQFLNDGDMRAERVDLLLSQAKPFYMASYLMDAVWSMPQIEISLIDFDYFQ